jgi:thiol-disulfide isomerase/thioredoxin
MKKLIGDLGYILLAVVLVFGVIQFALPNIAVDLTSAPLAPQIPPYVEEIEELAVYLDEGGLPPTVIVLVLNFWSPTCEYCLEELVALKDIQYADIAVVTFTTETDPAIVDEIIEELDLLHPVLYGLPEFPLSSLPNTHILMRGEDGTWKVLPGGSWIGFVKVETILQFIVDNTTE